LILSSLSEIYGAVASWRRRWYEREPERRRSLSRPVVSVGNLRVGGSGKTPIVAHLARLLLDLGHRPSILTRGYGRRRRTDGVTVVSDGSQVLADLSDAGDEPLMLARELHGVPVLVGSDRHAAGLLAERRFGATVHVLDDGFQHVQLERDVDLLLVDQSDLTDRPLPGGRLREPLRSAAAADAVLVTAEDPSACERVGSALGVHTAFRVARSLAYPSSVNGPRSVATSPGSPVFAAAGIARPERFFADLAGAGWQVAGSLAFRDHHHFTAADIARIEDAAAAAGARAIVTTAKDAVRLEALGDCRLPIIFVPLTAAIEPAAAFRSWLIARL
jgi:tetraacyldisaccharide 4'-kinase